MGIHLQQALSVGQYLVAQRLKGRQYYPLVLMLEPLFRCNLACSGCGKISLQRSVLLPFVSVVHPSSPFPAESPCYILKSIKLCRV